ncbi:hypothetical protein IU501_19805 [Nocardia otitidiscaviarum]|uniref:hypothetical protein n=1 Tax=Nocardia otitidiscaviarum TaxID=1823 RepID=UPI001892EB39|nr:hypothetical protein [Nocardia otitidiscaviarum]MBF6135233.1 hypothetical protein [Nocardia otitidiscaviarum]
MRAIGITSDTGFFHRGHCTHEPFTPEGVREDMRAIREELGCDAVRVTGGDRHRLRLAARCAADAGLEVWLCPFTNEVAADDLLEFLGDCADYAESLRSEGARVVLALGSELSLFVPGFLPGDTFTERAALLSTPRLAELLPELSARINAFLTRAVAVARRSFTGPLTYCSLPFEGVDWTPFDYVATDAGYRSAELADGYRARIRAAATGPTPLAITEFGCATYRGAPDAGPRGGDIVVWDPETAHPLALDGDHTRDEAGQAANLLELLDVFDAEGVDIAFWYTFASYHLPHRDDPRTDLDLASNGVVKVHDPARRTSARRWEPKAAFAALARRTSGTTAS